MANMDEHSLLWQCLMKLILIVCFSKKKNSFLFLCVETYCRDASIMLKKKYGL